MATIIKPSRLRRIDGRVKVHPNEYPTIIKRRLSGESLAKIARDYKVSTTTIFLIAKHHIENTKELQAWALKKQVAERYAKLVPTVLRMYESGIPRGKIAKILRKSRNTVTAILKANGIP